MRFRMVITGVEELLAKIEQIPEVAGDAGRTAVARETLAIEARMKQLVPKRTGEMERGIESRVIVDGAVAEGLILVSAPGALQQELGTTEHGPQPFIRPAANEGARERLRRTGRAVANAIEGLGRGG